MAANDGFIDYLSPTALAELKEGNAEVSKAIALIDKFNSKLSGAKTPSSSNSAINELKNSVVDTEKAVSKLQNQYTKLAEVRRTSNRQTAEEVVNQGILNRNAKQAATINSTLAGAYQRLAAEQNKSARALQDLVVRGRLASQTQKQYNAELARAQREFDGLNRRVLAADRAVGRFNRNVGNYPQLIRGFGDLLGAFGLVGGVTAIAAIGRDIFNTTRELQGMDLALTQVVGSAEEAAKAQEFLSRISEAYGINIQTLTKSYTGFWAAARNAMDAGAISGAQVNQIFESVSKAAGAMGLSVEQQEGAFLALQQMISKGNIQAEELRGQLSERLPGAFGILAKSMGVTETQLNKMLQDGKVLAAEVLPAFARELEKAYGVENLNRVESLNASVTRLGNTWTNFIRTLNEGSGTLTKVLSGLVDGMGKIIEGWDQLILGREGRRQQQLKMLQDQGYNEALSAYKDFTDEQIKQDEEYTRRLINGVQTQLAILRSRNSELEKNARNTPLGKIYSTKDNAEIKKNNAEIRRANNLLSKYAGYLLASREALKEETIATNESSDAIEKNKRIRQEAINAEKGLTDGLIDRLKDQITVVERLQRANSKTFEDWDMYQNTIEELNRYIRILTQGYTELQTAGDKGISTAEEQNRVYLEQEERVKALRKATEDYIATVANSSLGDLGMGSLQQFFDGTFDQLMEGADPLIEKFAVTFQAITEVAEEAFGFINDIQQRQFDQQYARLEQQKNIAILFAGESAAAREEIERQYEERRKAIARQQAEAQKKQAVFNILINTAQGVVAALASAPPNVPLSVAIGVIGAIQAGVVASTPIPQFYKGTENAPGGFAWVDERGPELHLDKHNRVKSTGEGKANLRLLAPGDKIKTAEETRNILTLNRMLYGSGVDPIVVPNSGVSKSDIKELLRAIPQPTNVELIDKFDGRGWERYKREKGQTTQLMNGKLRLENRTLKRG